MSGENSTPGNSSPGEGKLGSWVARSGLRKRWHALLRKKDWQPRACIHHPTHSRSCLKFPIFLLLFEKVAQRGCRVRAKTRVSKW